MTWVRGCCRKAVLAAALRECKHRINPACTAASVARCTEVTVNTTLPPPLSARLCRLSRYHRRQGLKQASNDSNRSIHPSIHPRISGKTKTINRRGDFFPTGIPSPCFGTKGNRGGKKVGGSRRARSIGVDPPPPCSVIEN